MLIGALSFLFGLAFSLTFAFAPTLALGFCALSSSRVRIRLFEDFDLSGEGEILLRCHDVGGCVFGCLARTLQVRDMGFDVRGYVEVGMGPGIGVLEIVLLQVFGNYRVPLD